MAVCRSFSFSLGWRLMVAIITSSDCFYSNWRMVEGVSLGWGDKLLSTKLWKAFCCTYIFNPSCLGKCCAAGLQSLKTHIFNVFAVAKFGLFFSLALSSSVGHQLEKWHFEHRSLLCGLLFPAFLAVWNILLQGCFDHYVFLSLFFPKCNGRKTVSLIVWVH